MVDSEYSTDNYKNKYWSSNKKSRNDKIRYIHCVIKLFPKILLY